MNTKKKGFTLIELVIAITISVIVITLIGTISFQAMKTSTENQIQSDLQGESENIQSLLVNVGTQSAGFSSLEVTGPTMIDSNYTVPNFRNNIRNVNGFVGVTDFTIKLPIGLQLDSIKLPVGMTFEPSTDYYEYEFKLVGTDEIKALDYNINKVNSTSNTSETVKRETTLSQNVTGINIKPLNRAAIDSGTLDNDTRGTANHILDVIPGVKFNIEFKKKKGFNNVSYEGSSIVNFRNKNI